MQYKLINENYTDNYVEQLVDELGGDALVLLTPNSSYLQSPDFLDNIEIGAQKYLEVLRRDGRIVIIVD